MLYAFDGTWNKDRPGTEHDSNVRLFATAYQAPDYYQKGVGTRFGRLGQIISGITGAGGRTRIDRALKKLEKRLDEGDTNIDIIGFSRGAAPALHFANQVWFYSRKKQVDVPIRFLGIWDAVPSFGVPGNSVDLGWDLDVPDNVARCYHAMALDERRKTFPLRRPSMHLADIRDAKRLVEVWFRGLHSDVGGGNRNPGLSSIALDWMFAQAKTHGLPIDPRLARENRRRMNPSATISSCWYDLIKDPKRTVQRGDLVHHTVKHRRDTRSREYNNPPAGLARVNNAGRKVSTFRWPART